jgi:hypothetical protein
VGTQAWILTEDRYRSPGCNRKRWLKRVQQRMIGVLFLFRRTPFGLASLAQIPRASPSAPFWGPFGDGLASLRLRLRGELALLRNACWV